MYLIKKPPMYEPVYPFFLGLGFTLSGGSDNGVRIIQIIISACSALLTYFFASRYVGEKAGFLAGLLFSLCPSFSYYPTFFLSETLMVFLFVGSYSYTLISIRSNRMKAILLAGVFLGILTLTRYTYLFFGLFVVLWFVANTPPQKSIIRFNWYGKLAVLSFLPIFIFSIWSLWQTSRLDSDHKNIRPFGKVLLYNGSEIALSEKLKVARLVGLVSRNLGETIFPDVDYQSLWPYPEIHKKLIIDAEARYSDIPNKDRRYLLYILDLYVENPMGYLLNRLTTLMRLNAFQYPSRLNETDRWKDFYNRGDSKSLNIILLDIFLKILGNPLVWALLGLIIMRKEKIPISPVIIPIIYINGIYCFLDGIPRYGLALLPFYFTAGSVFFMKFFASVKRFYQNCFIKIFNKKGHTLI